MTDLLRRIARRTVLPYRGKRLTVILEPGDVIGFRRERERSIEWTTLAACYDLAVRQRVRTEQAEKAAKKRR